MDHDATSGFTYSLCRAAQDAWGIGRGILDKGAPLWLNPDTMPLRPELPHQDSTPAPEPSSHIAAHKATSATDRHKPVAQVAAAIAEAQRKEISERLRDVPVETPVAQEPEPVKPKSANLANPIQLPRDGRSAFGWAKRVEETFDTRIIDEMVKHARDNEWPDQMFKWNAEQTRTICLSTVANLMITPKYNGQFDHLAVEVSAHSNKGDYKTE